MTTVVWVGLGVVAWLGIAVAAAIPIGKALHRAEHRSGAVDLTGCPSWCVRERAATLFDTQRRSGRHHATRRVRIHLGGRRHR